jgi:diketogulonate reductase-like aldo/keto reductase
MDSITACTTLNNGLEMPWFGLGVYKVEDGEEVKNSIRWALEEGYRHVDTAAFYENERGVGEALRSAPVPAEEVFLTTKLWNSDHGYREAHAAFEVSLGKLGMDSVDLYLIHWPVKGKFKETWKAFEEIYEKGEARAIGVSNFTIDQLEDLLADAKVRPTVNQIEFHPHLQQPDLVDYCKQKDIRVQAWSPIMRGNVGEVPELCQLADKHGKSPAQIVLRWDLQKEILTIPKSVHKDRIVENARIFDFELSPEDIALIDGLDKGERLGPDPANFSF